MKKIIFALSMAFLVSCAPDPAPKKVIDPAQKVEDVETPLSYKTTVDIDILFVIDDSYSMDKYQARLIQSLSEFTDAFYRLQFIDYHIGVTTSSTNDRSSRGYGGRMIEQDGFRFVDRNTPNGDLVLKGMLNAGTDGAGIERFFNNALSALTSPISDMENKGFLRENAYQLVVFLTDAEDQSGYKAEEFFDELVGIKGSENKVSVAAALIASGNPPACRRDPIGEPKKIERLIKISEGFQFNICSTAYGAELAKLAQKTVDRASVIRLVRVPIPSTIEVTFGTQVIPQEFRTGWTYDPNENTIYLGSEIELIDQPGAELSITFKEKILE